jgi:hypothetical protein
MKVLAARSDRHHRGPPGPSPCGGWPPLVAQSMVLGYGYGDWDDQLHTEGDPFAPPGRGRFERHLAAMRGFRSDPSDNLES